MWCRDTKMSPALRRGSVKRINDSPEPERDGTARLPRGSPGIPALATRRAMKCESNLLADAGPALPGSAGPAVLSRRRQDRAG